MKILVNSILLFILMGINQSRADNDVLIIGQNASIIHYDTGKLHIGDSIVLAPESTTFENDVVGKPLAVQYDRWLIEQFDITVTSPIVVRRAPGLRNAFAVIQGDQRLLVFDPDWYRAGSTPIDTDDAIPFLKRRYSVSDRQAELVDRT